MPSAAAAPAALDGVPASFVRGYIDNLRRRKRVRAPSAELAAEHALAIRTAWSIDGGASFGAIRTFAAGRTLGRVDVVPVGGGVFALVHLVDVSEADEGKRAAWECVFVARGAVPTGAARIETVEGGRRSGLLSLAPAGPEAAWAAWTGSEGLRLARIERGRVTQESGGSFPSSDAAAR